MIVEKTLARRLVCEIKFALYPTQAGLVSRVNVDVGFHSPFNSTYQARFSVAEKISALCAKKKSFHFIVAVLIMNFSEVVYIFFGRHKIYQVETRDSFALVSTSNCSPVCAEISEKSQRAIDSLAVSHSTVEFARSQFLCSFSPFPSSSISSMFESRSRKSGRERSWVRQQRQNISVLFYPTESRSRAHFVETTGCEFFSPSDTQSEMMMRLLVFFWEENASLSLVYTDQRRVRGITPTKVVEWSGKESEEKFSRISKKSSSTSLCLPSSTGRLNWAVQTRRVSE